MPFAVFRRHQRKLLAVLAILAMFTFVVADSLPRLLNGAGTGDPAVVDLFGATVRRNDIAAMQAQRNDANLFMAEMMGLLNGRSAPNFFGDLSTKSMVDALILQHKADELGMPVGPEVARDWLKQSFNNLLSPQLFDAIVGRFNQRISSKRLLSEISNQIRLARVRQLLGGPIVTPLDVYQVYRDQNEKVSAKAVAFRVGEYLAKVPAPDAAQLRAYYDKYKNDLPDPLRPTPGFKVPRQVQAEILSIDGAKLAKAIEAKLTEPELLSYYENRKSDFKKESGFPDEIFAGHPELTPPSYRPFTELRPFLGVTLADEKAQSEILAKFGKVKDEDMIPFADEYLDAADALAEAAKTGETRTTLLPLPKDLTDVAKRKGLDHEITPMLGRERADHYGTVSGAELGLTPFSGGRKFAEELFDSKSSLFEPIELCDPERRRYLVRKLKDAAPRVPSFEESRGEVERAWKTEQARPLAEKAARDFAEAVRKAGGKIAGEVAEGGHPVVTTRAVARLQPGAPLPGQFFQSGPAVASVVPELPDAGGPLREALFNLNAGEVAVAPDQPQSVYYVLAFHSKTPAPFAALYAPNGDYIRYRNEAMEEAIKHRDEEWMEQLRAEAGLKPGWVPPDEAAKAG